ncbi:MAG: DNA adenine methylase [Clostridia bacterium]|nr:DNA adenine methylase [Clostridia bacterium]
MKKFINAPLPFQGQKRRFIKQLEEMAKQQEQGTVFVDLFGGSGLISHTIKQARPDCRVVYNDYDHYCERLSNVNRTNAMFQALRPIIKDVHNKQRIDEPMRSQVIAEVERWNKSGYVDWISLSSNLLFTMNYAHNFDEFRKSTLYNRLRKDDYDVEGYLDGVEIVSMDYRRLFDLFSKTPCVVFILDPPYLSTDCSTYRSDNYWRLSDYLDVLKCLQGTKFVYFTSSKSTIVELADWMGRNQSIGNPFEGAKTHRLQVKGPCLNYDDIMLVKAA